MKMEEVLLAPGAGVVASLAAPGDAIAAGGLAAAVRPDVGAGGGCEDEGEGECAVAAAAEPTAAAAPWGFELEQLAAMRRAALALGGERGVARQRAQGKATVRERIDALLDSGSFHEVGSSVGRLVGWSVGDRWFVCEVCEEPR